ncbi:hypothetical protein RUM43_009301, partial [Polyplax serrata]
MSTRKIMDGPITKPQLRPPNQCYLIEYKQFNIGPYYSEITPGKCSLFSSQLTELAKAKRRNTQN